MLKILNPLVDTPPKPPPKPKKLTDAFIRSRPAAPDGQRYAISDFGDGMVAGLKVRVTDKGAKSFILWRRYGGSKHPAARSLGTVGAITLAEAREKAREWIKLIERGEDPRVVERRARVANQESNSKTFGVVFEDYLKRKVKKLRKAKDIEREMRTDLLSRWKDKPLREITRRDVIRMTEAVAERGPYQAHNVLGHAKTFFNWVIVHDIIDGFETSPADKIRPGDLIGKKKVRQRVLDDAEIKAFWRATGKMDYPFGTLFRMLLLTGQRRSEIAEASRHEINKRILTIPPERFKSDSEQLLPLTSDAMMILDTIPRWNAGDFLFSTTHGATAVNGFSFQKRKLNDMMTVLLDKKMENFVLHDLRRTVRTRLSDLKIRDEVAEMIIGHGRKGMQRVYDQHKYVDEMREALELWNARVRELVA
jgi:integrase